ncbi:MAG: MBL fold metallo-hydrolase [Proteobacteria bacterium]|nr:MBL fold metallo-hydrolase [Pseudomonadota bacterium]
MIVTFYGAVREVTGSMHLFSANKDNILLDCGMFQGRRKESEMKNRTFPIDPRMVTNMILSHAHIDHSGRIPLLTQGGFTGRIITTRTTADASEYLLLDAGHIQESDADYLNYKTLRGHLYKLQNSHNKGISNREKGDIQKLLKKSRHELNVSTIKNMMEDYNLNTVEPIYTQVEARNALSFFDGYPYKEPVTIGKGMTVTFYDAGHILGSAMCLIRFRENGRQFTVCYTGDIGRFDRPILEDPTMHFPEDSRNIDLMIMESTYGARHHETVDDLKIRMKKVVCETIEKGGSILIPAFAYGRTQDVIYVLHELYDKGEVPRVPVYVDSPLGTKITKVFGEHPEVYDRETHKTFLEKGENPFAFKELKYTESVEESMEIMKETRPHIVISSSGMCEAGRILHHLRWKIHNPKNTVLIVGYMAEHTLGRRIVDLGWEYEQSGRQGAAPELKILGKTYPLNARVVKLSGFSAHADQGEMTRFLKQGNLKVKRIAVVHGEEDQSLQFAEHLKQNGFNATVPHRGEVMKLYE